MMKSRITCAGLALAMLGAVPVQAAAPSVPSGGAKAAPAATFVPADFVVPTLADAGKFKLVPLGPDLAMIDYEAYMSSIEHLQKTFSRSDRWPSKDITHADAMKDMENEQGRFNSRRSFAYGVLTADGTRELGSVYVSPSPVEGYDAMVRMWVTKAAYDAGFDAELYQWVQGWVGKQWPFRKVVYPGRSVEWSVWDEQVAAARAKKPAN
jgi:hypothetical protein